MLIGVPKEIITGEKRVSITPAGVERLVEAGHQVIVQAAAGEGSRFSDDAYRNAGACVVADAPEVWGRAELLVKVKQPTEAETSYFHEGLVYLGYLHAAYRPWLVEALLERKVTAFAAEKIALDNGDRPLLIPMSEIAGRLAVMTVAHYLADPPGSAGVMLGCIGDQATAHLLILGGGTVGRSAAATASSLGARVTVVDREPERVRERLAEAAPRAVLHPDSASRSVVEALLPKVDAIINGVLWDPQSGEHLVTREGLRQMRPGSVIVDVDCTPGGAIETTRVMTLDCPTFVKEGVIHYCVPNMPASVPQTSTQAFAQATLPYVELIAGRGLEGALAVSKALERGLVTRQGRLLDKHVAEVQGR
ncbi:MAG: alanine dehydrogenase [Candidatus Zipacnadales bacterium]